MAKTAKFIVCADADAVAAAAAERIVAISQETGPAAAIALSGGSTPERLYRLLASDDWRGRVNWRRLHWFWGDERFVPVDHPDSNTRMVRAAMLDPVGAPPETVHVIPTNAPDPFAAAALYESELQRFYGATTLHKGRPLFDLVLLGLGEDGHTASLFPGKPALDERERWMTGVPEAGLAPFVPRVTLTFPAIASSRTVLFLATGAAKREMIARIRAGSDLPAVRVGSEGEVIWLVDRAAAE